MGFRQNYNQTDPVNSNVLDNVPLGTPFTVSIHATSDLQLSVEVSCNGRTSSVPSMVLDPSWASHTFDFHGGVYNQVDYSDATLATDASVCIISNLEVTHA